MAYQLPTVVFWALCGQACYSISRFLTKVVVGGRFGSGSEAQLGFYEASFGVLLLAVAIQEAFVTSPLTVFISRQKKEELGSFSGNMLKLSLGLGISIGACILFFSMVDKQFSLVSTGLATTILAVALLAPFQLLREFSRRWLLAQIKPRQSASFDFLFTAIYLLALVGLLLASRISATNVFLMMGIANLFTLIAWWFIYRESFALSDKQNFNQQLSNNYRYGRWIAGENIAAVGTLYFSNWFLLARLGEEAAGVFAACMSIVLLANPFLLGVSSILAPRAAQEFSSHGWTALKKVLVSYGMLVLAVLVPLAFGMYFFGEWLTTAIFGDKYGLFFGETYNGTNHVTFLLSVAMPFFGLSYVLSCGLLACDRPNLNLFASLIALVLTIGVNLSFAEPNLVTVAISFGIAGIGMTLFRIVAFWTIYHRATKLVN